MTEKVLYEYRVASGKNLPQLEEEVNELLKTGWKVHGSFVFDVDHTADDWFCFQAMIRGVSDGDN